MFDVLFATAATADQIDAGIGVIWWATNSPDGYALTVLDYNLADVADINSEWLGGIFARSAELVTTHRPATRGCVLRVEHSGLTDVLKRANAAYRATDAADAIDRSEYDIRPIRDHEREKWPATLDERAYSIRPLVDSAKVVKVEMGLRLFNWRAIRANQVLAQVKRHRPGDATSAGELLHAFVLGVLLGTTPKTECFFTVMGRQAAQSTPSSPFGAYVPGRRPM